MAFTLKEIEPTPNPNALKFALSGRISERPNDFDTAEQAGAHPLAAVLFSIPGVTRVFWVADFITITKAAEGKWPAIRKKAKQAIESYSEA